MGSLILPTDDISSAMWPQPWSLAVRADVARLFYNSDHGTKIKLDTVPAPGVPSVAVQPQPDSHYYRHGHFAVTASSKHPESSSHPGPEVSWDTGVREWLPGSTGQVRAGGHGTLSPEG